MDIRWQQRFKNFNKTLSQLERFLQQGELNEMETQGLIKAFEYTFELSWKTLQDILKEKGYIDIVGPRPVIEQSFQDGYITDGKDWLLMLKSRNLTSHSYDEQTAEPGSVVPVAAANNTVRTIWRTFVYTGN
jgi:nucleotidyltransferase substrate binding protein (TIGR01987 family)